MKWEIISSCYPFACQWIKVRKDCVRLPSGMEIPDYYVSELKDFVNVIALTTDGRFIIVKQYRHGVRRICYELSAGCIEHGESPLDAARRELLEETGYSGGKWADFGCSVVNASNADNVCYTFLARGVERRQKPILDDTEEIRVFLIDEWELKLMMQDGRIAEGTMLAPLWRFFANERQS